MDPLTLTTGILTLIGACAATSRTLAKIRHFAKAHSIIDAIENEMVELKLMLVHIGEHLESTNSRGLALSNTNKPVLRLCASIINRTRDKIQEVDSLIQHQLLKKDKSGSTILNKIAFARNHGKLIKLQTELRELGQRIADVGSILGAEDTSRIEDALNDIRSNDFAMLNQRLIRIEKSFEGLRGTQSGSFNDPPGLPQTSSNTSSSIAVSVSRLKPTASPIRCTCCHQEAFTYLQTFLGMLFLGFAATPKQCPYHSRTELRVVYFFPPWLFGYIVWLQLQSGPIVCALSYIPVIPHNHIALDMIRYGDVEGIKVLLISGQLSIKAQMTNGANLLHWAIWQANTLSTKFLVLEASADKFHESPFHLTPQAAAWDRILARDKSSEWREALQSLFSEPDFDECYQFSPLHKAVLGLSSRPIESVLNEDISQLNSTDSYGRTSLLWAAFRGDHKAIQKLLPHQPDCSKGDKAGETALVYACRKSIQCMKLLMANANIHWRHGMTQGTLLHVAIRNLENDGGLARVKMLVEADIEVNAQNVYGETALHLAIHPQKEYTKSASYLINQKADLAIHDNSGNNALSNAVRRNCHALIELLLQEHQDHTENLKEYCTFVHLIAEFADVDTLRLLIQGKLKRRNIGIKNRFGLTSVDLALRRDDVDVEWRDAFWTLLKILNRDM